MWLLTCEGDGLPAVGLGPVRLKLQRCVPTPSTPTTSEKAASSEGEGCKEAREEGGCEGAGERDRDARETDAGASETLT